MTNYWFYILKGINEEGDSFNIDMNVFKATTRDEAKSLLTEKYPNTPFRKPKLFNHDTTYLYLTPSSEYWYDFHNKACKIVCECCERTVEVIGQKNIIRNKYGEYCSIECKEQRVSEVALDYISEEDHYGLSYRNREELVGYIYKITNKHTMEYYVGQTVKPALFRWWQHLKTDKKFGQVDIADLVFEVLEVVTFGEDDKQRNLYTSAKDKLNKREAHFIQLYDCVEEGFNTIQPKEIEYDLFTIQNVEI